MKDLITEARELCERASKGPWELSANRYAVWSSGVHDLVAQQLYTRDANFVARSRTLIPELCDALEKAEEQNKQLMHELCKLACESVEREKVLAKLEAEVMAVTEPKRGEWVEAKSGVMSVYPPGQVMCSVCKQRMPSQWKKMPPYCYGCGAKMEDKPCG